MGEMGSMNASILHGCGGSSEGNYLRTVQEREEGVRLDSRRRAVDAENAVRGRRCCDYQSADASSGGRAEDEGRVPRRFPPVVIWPTCSPLAAPDFLNCSIPRHEQSVHLAQLTPFFFTGIWIWVYLIFLLCKLPFLSSRGSRGRR